MIEYPLISIEHCSNKNCKLTYNLTEKQEILDYLHKLFYSDETTRIGFRLASIIKTNKNIQNFVQTELFDLGFTLNVINKMSANQKIYHILYKINEIPLCKQCGVNHVKFDISTNLYHSTCGTICNNLYIENINKRLKNNFNHTNTGKHENYIINKMFPNNSFKKNEKIGAFFPDFLDYESKTIFEINEVYHFKKDKQRTDKRKYGYLKSIGWKIIIIFDFCERKLTKHMFNNVINWSKNMKNLVNDIYIFNESNVPKILTKDGWSLFGGIISYSNIDTKKVNINNTQVICTSDHKFLLNNKLVEAHELPNENNGKETVYDILNVEKNNLFLINKKIISHNCLICDEFAFLKPNLEEGFMNSVFPVVSSSKTSQIIIVSTPNGSGNEFYRIWNKAVLNKNKVADDDSAKWTPIRIDWWEVPGRDEKWKKEQMETFNGSEERFNQEYGNCVGGDSIISIYDIDKQEYREIKIKDLFNEI